MANYGRAVTKSLRGTRSYKIDDEPLLNLKGADQLLKREGTFVLWTQKRELESPL